MINYLLWDSSFFDIPIYELKDEDIVKANLDKEIHSLSSGSLIQYKANIESLKLIEKLISHDFSVEDSGVTYEKTVDNKILKFSDFRLELAKEQDKDKEDIEQIDEEYYAEY